MFLGIDIGGTKIRIGEVEKERVINAFSEKTEKGNILKQIITLVNKFDNVEGVGIGIAGQVRDGVVVFSPNIPEIINLNLYNALKKEFPLFIENDANCQTIGEYKYGAGKGMDSIVGIFIGTGIGGGIIINKRLIERSEIGHMVISNEGRCGCGKIGCFEALASGTSLLRYAKEASFPEGSASYIQRRAKKGCEKAIKIIEKLGLTIGIGVTNLVNIFNPNAVILGGGVISEIPDLVSIVERFVKNYAIFPSLVKKASLGADSGIIGASYIARRKGKL